MKGSLRSIITLCLLLGTLSVLADSRKDFIRKYKNIAIREMERTGIPGQYNPCSGYSGIRMREIGISHQCKQSFRNQMS